jgi:hypothetical protein
MQPCAVETTSERFRNRTMSEGGRDLRAVLDRPDATALLPKILARATPVGQLYALLGLRLRDRPAYEQALPALEIALSLTRYNSTVI